MGWSATTVKSSNLASSRRLSRKLTLISMRDYQNSGQKERGAIIRFLGGMSLLNAGWAKTKTGFIPFATPEPGLMLRCFLNVVVEQSSTTPEVESNVNKLHQQIFRTCDVLPGAADNTVCLISPFRLKHKTGTGAHDHCLAGVTDQIKVQTLVGCDHD